MHMTLSDLLIALRMRWKVEAIVALCVFVAVGLWVWSMPRIYQANASLLFDELSPEPVAATTGKTASLIGTQADIIKSEAIASKVVQSLGMLDNADAVSRWRQATGGAGDPSVWLGRALLPNLEVTPGNNSNVLLVSYKSNDPQFSALMANAFASVYVDERLQLRTDPAKTYTKWFEVQSRDVRQKLEQAQNRMTAFQRAHGIVDDGAFNAETALLNDYLHQKATSDAEAASARGRANGGSANISVQESSVVSLLRSDLARERASYQQLSTQLGPNHPSMISQRAKVAALEARLSNEVGVAMGSLRASTGASFYQQADLTKLVAEQRARILKLSADRSQAEMLRRDVDSARAAYDTVMQRLSEMRLQSDLPRTNVRQLDQAMPPALPASPRVALLMFLGLLLAAMAGATVGVILEWLRPTVRTPDGLEEISAVPVAARIDFRRSSVQPLLLGEAA